MFVHIFESQDKCVAVKPYIVNHIREVLKAFNIDFSEHNAFLYHDIVTCCRFVIHPQTHKKLWVQDTLSLEMQGFSALSEKVPRVARVAEEVSSEQ